MKIKNNFTGQNNISTLLQEFIQFSPNNQLYKPLVQITWQFFKNDFQEGLLLTCVENKWKQIISFKEALGNFSKPQMFEVWL